MKKIAFCILASIVMPLFLLTALELGARVLSKGFHLVSAVNVKNRLTIEKDEDSDTFWRLRAFRNPNFPNLMIDADGFRGARIDFNKPESEFRIACMGDSVTFGNEVTSYPDELAKLLSKYEPNKRKIVVKNFGIPGYSSFQGTRVWARYVKAWKPDLVILAYIWNDLWLTRFYEDGMFMTDRQKWQANKNTKYYQIKLALRNIINRSKFILYSQHVMSRLIGNRQHKKIPWEKRKDMRVAPGEYAQNISFLIEQAVAGRAKAVCLGLPSAFQSADLADYYVNQVRTVHKSEEIRTRHRQYSALLEKTCKNLRVPFIDIRFPGAREIFYNEPGHDPVHPNKKGLQFIGEEIAKVLNRFFLNCRTFPVHS